MLVQPDSVLHPGDQNETAEAAKGPNGRA